MKTISHFYFSEAAFTFVSDDMILSLLKKLRSDSSGTVALEAGEFAEQQYYEYLENFIKTNRHVLDGGMSLPESVEYRDICNLLSTQLMKLCMYNSYCIKACSYNPRGNRFIIECGELLLRMANNKELQAIQVEVNGLNSIRLLEEQNEFMKGEIR